MTHYAIPSLQAIARHIAKKKQTKNKKKKKKNKPNTQTNKKISSFKAGKAIIVDGVHPLKKRSFQGLHFSTKVRNLKC